MQVKGRIAVSPIAGRSFESQELIAPCSRGHERFQLLVWENDRIDRASLQRAVIARGDEPIFGIVNSQTSCRQVQDDLLMGSDDAAASLAAPFKVRILTARHPLGYESGFCRKKLDELQVGIGLANLEQLAELEAILSPPGAIRMQAAGTRLDAEHLAAPKIEGHSSNDPR